MVQGESGWHRSASRPLRIGLCAEAFGFGPASKAVAIIRKLSAIAPIEVTILATSVAREYFEKEGFSCGPALDPREANDQASIIKLARHLDGAIVALDGTWVDVLAPVTQVFFVDSLGFMWDAGFFVAHPALTNLPAYYVQDVFGAGKRLNDLGIQNINSVGAIINPNCSVEIISAPTAPFRYVATLGGLKSHLQTWDPRCYVDFVLEILNGAIADMEDCAILCSRSSNVSRAEADHYTIMCVSQSGAVGIYRSALMVFASPGLTTLLELADLEVPLVPLPPQNLSQALILMHLAANYSELPAIYRFLAAAYAVSPELDEAEGVRFVEQRNLELMQSSDFRRDMVAMVIDARAAPAPIPRRIVPDFKGAEAIAQSVLQILGNSPV